MHAALEQACSSSGLVPEHISSAAAFWEATSRHATIRVFLPLPQVTEQAPHTPLFHSYVMQICVLHALLLAGSVFEALAVQNESATDVIVDPCVALHELPVRAWMPPPQALEHAP